MEVKTIKTTTALIGILIPQHHKAWIVNSNNYDDTTETNYIGREGE